MKISTKVEFMKLLVIYTLTILINVDCNKLMELVNFTVIAQKVGILSGYY